MNEEIKYYKCTNPKEWAKNIKANNDFYIFPSNWKNVCDKHHLVDFKNSSNWILSTKEEYNAQFKTNNKQITMEKLMLDVLSKTYNNPILRRTTVPLFMSDPGIGKTHITEAFVKKFIESKGNKMVSMILPNLMPNEAVGGVYPNASKKIWEFYDSEKLSSLEDGDVLFLDEVFNGTLKQTLDAMLNVLGQRRLGSGKQMADVMIVAASNPQGLIHMTPQIKQRFIKYELKFNSEEYQNYLKNKYGMPESISINLCSLINKEKFDSVGWDYVTPRSVEKAINQIGCDLETPYDDLLIPFLSNEIISPMDIDSLNIKKEDKVPYINLLKLIIKSKNDNENNKQKSRITSNLLS